MSSKYVCGGTGTQQGQSAFHGSMGAFGQVRCALPEAPRLQGHCSSPEAAVSHTLSMQGPPRAPPMHALAYQVPGEPSPWQCVPRTNSAAMILRPPRTLSITLSLSECRSSSLISFSLASRMACLVTERMASWA